MTWLDFEGHRSKVKVSPWF